MFLHVLVMALLQASMKPGTSKLCKAFDYTYVLVLVKGEYIYLKREDKYLKAQRKNK